MHAEKRPCKKKPTDPANNWQTRALPRSKKKKKLYTCILNRFRLIEYTKARAQTDYAIADALGAGARYHSNNGGIGDGESKGSGPHRTGCCVIA